MIKVHVSGLMICGMKSSVLEAPDTQVLCSTELEREKREKFSGILCIFFFMDRIPVSQKTTLHL